MPECMKKTKKLFAENEICNLKTQKFRNKAAFQLSSCSKCCHLACPQPMAASDRRPCRVDDAVLLYSALTEMKRCSLH